MSSLLTVAVHHVMNNNDEPLIFILVVSLAGAEYRLVTLEEGTFI